MWLWFEDNAQLPFLLQEQYIFVYDVLLEALICGDTTIPLELFTELLSELLQFEQHIGKTKLEEQFEVRTYEMWSKMYRVCLLLFQH